jgi:hypothetical protein
MAETCHAPWKLIAMHFYTETECEEWLSGQNRSLPNTTTSAALRLWYPKRPYRMIWWAQYIAETISKGLDCLLWITERGIWGSSENTHLYYRLRQSYRDLRLIHDAPGHLFMKHEVEDLASFLQIAMLNGWGGYVLNESDYVNAFFSHDEFIDFYTHDKPVIDEIKKYLNEDTTSKT